MSENSNTPPSRPKRKRPNLSLREIRFAEHYVENQCAADAYRTAFPPAASDQATRVLAFRVLRNPAVQRLIYDLRQEALDAARVSVARIAQALARVAFCDRADLFDEEGALLPPHRWPADVRATVESVESEDIYTTVSGEGGVKRRELRGHVRKVHTAKRTEALRILATWKKMIGRDSEIESMSRELERLRELLQQVRREQHGQN
jgi:phage terminase small subunit